MRPYTDLAELDGFYLEESYVLGMIVTIGEVILDLDLVLTPAHPEYAQPRPGEQYHFRRGLLKFRGVSRVLWTQSGLPPALDASGEVDFGQIDSFEWDDAGALLEGAWGRMEIMWSAISVELV